jgi:hypothetical protein
MSSEVSIPEEAIAAADHPHWTTKEKLRAAAPLIVAANEGQSDVHVVAYASLHEIVRRFLAGEANRRYLARRFEEIEEDLRRAVVERRRASALRGEEGQ